MVVAIAVVVALLSGHDPEQGLASAFRPSTAAFRLVHQPPDRHTQGNQREQQCVLLFPVPEPSRLPSCLPSTNPLDFLVVLACRQREYSSFTSASAYLSLSLFSLHTDLPAWVVRDTSV
ncbi:hypothetical protein F4860DRAFT_439394 [Xylaria cubensis]|nr:hypothetical protein F4860DRAFT_439394 [Xylaria cubensis]